MALSTKTKFLTMRRMASQSKASCWICGAAADSAEHRLKKADIIRAYGKGQYFGPTALVHVRGELVSSIQGPGSVKIKYDKSLCHKCNTTTTQSYDSAYDVLINWVMANETAALRKRFLNFEEVYGAQWEDHQRNLFKYWVKSLGCRIVDAGRNVPQDLINLLPLKAFRTALKITFSVNEDALLLDEQTRAGFIGKGDLFGWISKSKPEIVDGYLWQEHVSWFTIFYWYGREPEGGLGSTWIANSQYVYLGSSAPLSSEQRADFLLKR